MITLFNAGHNFSLCKKLVTINSTISASTPFVCLTLMFDVTGHELYLSEYCISPQITRSTYCSLQGSSPLQRPDCRHMRSGRGKRRTPAEVRFVSAPPSPHKALTESVSTFFLSDRTDVPPRAHTTGAVPESKTFCGGSDIDCAAAHFDGGRAASLVPVRLWAPSCTHL